MEKVISDVRLCPIARECRNNRCIMRMMKVFNYPIDPSLDSERKKARDVESKYGVGYLPKMETLFRDGSIQIICKDFKDK